MNARVTRRARVRGKKELLAAAVGHLFYVSGEGGGGGNALLRARDANLRAHGKLPLLTASGAFDSAPPPLPSDNWE